MRAMIRVGRPDPHAARALWQAISERKLQPKVSISDGKKVDYCSSFRSLTEVLSCKSGENRARFAIVYILPCKLSCFQESYTQVSVTIWKNKPDEAFVWKTSRNAVFFYFAKQVKWNNGSCLASINHPVTFPWRMWGCWNFSPLWFSVNFTNSLSLKNWRLFLVLISSLA